MITTALLLICLFSMLSMAVFNPFNRNIKIVSLEMIKDNRAYVYGIDEHNGSHIIDTQRYDADYIDCTYMFNDKQYKVLVNDYYDLTLLNTGPDDKLNFYDIVKAELYKEKSPFTNDVTQKLIEYSGPYKDFYGKDIRTLDFKTIFAFVKTAPDDWLLRVHMRNGDIDIIHI